MQIKLTFLQGALLALSASVVYAASEIHPDADPNGDKIITKQEYINFQKLQMMRGHDDNKDGVLTKEEWLKDAGDFRIEAWGKFNANGDSIFQDDEKSQVGLWVFLRRDKNKDNLLMREEIPAFAKVK